MSDQVQAVEFMRRRFREMQHGRAQWWRQIVLTDPCPYCCLCPRADFGKHRMTIEHVTPVVCGGSNQWHNLAGAHEGCNQQRGARPLLRFLLFRHQSTGRSKKDRRRLRQQLFSGQATNSEGRG